MKIETKIGGKLPCYYPCLKQSEITGGFVLFSAPGVGTALSVTDLGRHSSTWIEDNFVLLPPGTTITLTQ